MITLTPPVESLRYAATLFRYAFLWKIERALDSEVFYFTSHNVAIEFEGNTYESAQGMQASAQERNVGLASRDATALGVISSDQIQLPDLIGGLFEGSLVTEYLVDWAYPFAGAFREAKYWIDMVKYDREVWRAELVGRADRLRHPIGQVMSRSCHHQLWGDDCGLTKASWKVTGTISAITTDRRVFETTLTEADNYFRYGQIKFTSGACDGLWFELQAYKNTDGKVYLVRTTPYAVAVSDTFDIYPGCNHTYSHCGDQFSNLTNFGGKPWISGTIKQMQSPNAN